MTAIKIELGRVDDHGLPRRDLHKLIDEIEGKLFDVQEAQGIKSVHVVMTVEPEREAGQ